MGMNWELSRSRTLALASSAGLSPPDAHRIRSPTLRLTGPECDLPEPELNISSAYDIWTLGCLYLEFITWSIGGWTLLVEFDKLRRRSRHGLDRTKAFFEVSGSWDHRNHSSHAEIKPIVLEVCLSDRCCVSSSQVYGVLTLNSTSRDYAAARNAQHFYATS